MRRVAPPGARVAALLLAATTSCTCGKAAPPAVDEAGSAAAAPAEGASPAASLSPPLAAARADRGAVLVAGLSGDGRAVRVLRIGADDRVEAQRDVLSGVEASPDAEVRLAPAGPGAALTWRGKRAGAMARELVVLGAELAPRGEPAPVESAACATLDAHWSSSGAALASRTWGGQALRIALPSSDDVAVVCAAHRAYALLESEDGTRVAIAPSADAGGAAPKVVTVFRDGEPAGEPREHAEVTVGDDLIVFRLSTDGSIAVREVSASGAGPLRRVAGTIPVDDDLVAADGTGRMLLLVYTEDASDGCPTDVATRTRVKALRIDRGALRGEPVELSPGACGREVGPFFTGPVGDGLAVSWVERVPVVGKARAPIAGVGYAVVPPTGAPGPVGRVEQAAAALADAGCDGARCRAIALVGAEGGPGAPRVLRYP